MLQMLQKYSENWNEIITSFELENKIKTTLFLSNFELNQKILMKLKIYL